MDEAAGKEQRLELRRTEMQAEGVGHYDEFVEGMDHAGLC